MNTKSRRQQPQTAAEYLERYLFERATLKLLWMIREDKPKSDLMEMVDYILEFYQDNDLVAMGWVGSDGLP